MPLVEICFGVTFCFAVALVGHRKVCFGIQRKTTFAGAFVCMLVGLKVLGLALGVQLQDVK